MKKSDLVKFPKGTKLWVEYNGPVPCRLDGEDGRVWLNRTGGASLCVGRFGDVDYRDIFATFDDYRARFASAFKRGWR